MAADNETGAQGTSARNKGLEIVHMEMALEIAIWKKLPGEKIFVRRGPRSGP